MTSVRCDTGIYMAQSVINHRMNRFKQYITALLMINFFILSKLWQQWTQQTFSRTFHNLYCKGLRSGLLDAHHRACWKKVHLQQAIPEWILLCEQELNLVENTIGLILKQDIIQWLHNIFQHLYKGHSKKRGTECCTGKEYNVTCIGVAEWIEHSILH